ncbi:MAG: hypothetical protein JSV26_05900, partial [bacterium]
PGMTVGRKDTDNINGDRGDLTVKGKGDAGTRGGDRERGREGEGANKRLSLRTGTQVKQSRTVNYLFGFWTLDFGFAIESPITTVFSCEP